MTYITVRCPVCEVPLKQHTGNIPYTVRMHIDRNHPDLAADIRKVEQEVKDAKRALRARTGSHCHIGW